MKRHALFVGVDKYSDSTIQNLNYPSEDATELASVFRRLLKFNRVEKLINPKHSPEVVDAVKDMTRGLGSGDLFLCFFAGHGFRVKENHVLVCAKDEFADLEDEYAGLPVGQLKKRMRGPWNRMLILDACQNDIRATRGADTGVTERDLALIHEAEGSSSESGYQIVLTACSEGQKALEVSDLGHGLFTSAFLDSVTSFADARRRLDLEALRADLGKRMGGMIAQYRLSGRQEPLFTMPTDASRIVLLDGATSVSVPHYTPPPPIVSSLVVCPVCGKKSRPEDTFRCRVCGRDNICIQHQDMGTFLCAECTLIQRKARKEAERRNAEAECAVRARVGRGSFLKKGLGAICKALKTPEHKKIQLWAEGPYWADRNIGADNPEDAGYYFWWGDAVGYKRKGYSWVASGNSWVKFMFERENVPTYGKDRAALRCEGWITANGVLAPKHDAAHVQWGGEWRIPTWRELKDLTSKCDWRWSSMNNVNGYIVRGRGDYSSASIFLPCVGGVYGTSLHNLGSNGVYCSPVPDSGKYTAYVLDFYLGKRYTGYGDRSCGWPVRPVQGFAK